MRGLSLFILSSVLALPAFAVDPGTYRPGMTYDSISAANANICESQCSGDAQCRGWNFVKINPTQTTGICEFNAREAAPVPSPYSISGDNISQFRSAKLIQGRNNTVRVGDVAGSVQRSAPATKRRVVREPIPQRLQPQSTSYQKPPVQRRINTQHQLSSNNGTSKGIENLSLTQQQNLQRQKSQYAARQALKSRQRPNQTQASRQNQPMLQRPHFQHALDDAHSAKPAQQAMRTPRATVSQSSRFAGDPRLQQRVQRQRQMSPTVTQTAPTHPQSRGPQRQRRDSINTQSQAAYSQRGLTAPPNVPPMQTQHQNLPVAPQAMPSYAAQQRVQAQAPALPPQNQRAIQRRAQRPSVSIPSEMAPQLNAGQAQANLFGSLNDDVKIPRPVNPAAIAANPDAPIPTVANVPVKPVQMGPMPAPQSGSLAGGL